MQAQVERDLEGICRIVAKVAREAGPVSDGLEGALTAYVLRTLDRKYDPTRQAKVTTVAYSVARHSLAHGSEFLRLYGPRFPRDPHERSS